jgi:NodT family efflux transporter outer membrane factor (OMF) lipoprotein
MKQLTVMHKRSIKLLGSTLLAVLFMAACRVAAPPALPDIKPLPAEFLPKPDTSASMMDSTSAGDFHWNVFYSDSLLLHLIDTVLKNNPDQQIAFQRVEIMNQLVNQRRAAFLPSFQGVVSGGLDRYGEYTMNGVGNWDMNLSPNLSKEQKVPNPVPDLFVGIRSQWEIDIWGKLKAQKKAAIARLMAAENGRRYLTTQLVAQVASLYYELAASDIELDIIQNNIKLQQQALEVVKIQKEGGRATELAVQQFEAQLYRTQSLEWMMKQRIVAIENQLSMLANQYDQPIKRQKFSFQDITPSPLPVGFPADVLLNRPDIKEAELNLEATKSDLAAIRAAFLPALTLQPMIGLHTYNTSKWINPESLTWGILGGLTAPLLNRRQLKADFNISTAEQKIAFNGYQQTLVTAYNEISTQMNNWSNLSQQFYLKEKEFNVLSKAVQTARDLYVGGYANYLEVITAQKGVLDAELEMVDTRLKMMQAKVDLYRALGGGWQ